MNDFARCLKVSGQDVKDTFKTLEKRSTNNIMVDPHTKTVVKALHCWAKTCFWLNVDPEQTPFPKDNASAILDRAELHKQFVEDASDNKTSMKPDPFTKDAKWDEWAKSFAWLHGITPCLRHL